jgi:hypothetical protein
MCQLTEHVLSFMETWRKADMSDRPSLREVRNGQASNSRMISARNLQICELDWASRTIAMGDSPIGDGDHEQSPDLSVS